MEIPTGRHSYDIRLLIEAGQSVEAEHVWTYQAISALLQREVSGNDSALQTALRRLSRDSGIEFRNIRKIGYLRLSDEGIVDQAPTDRLGVSRKVKRISQRAGNVQSYVSLPPRLQQELDAHRTVLAVMRDVVKPSNVKKISDEVALQKRELDVVEATLRLFKPISKP